MGNDDKLITQEIGSFRKPDYLSNVFKKERDQEKLRRLKERATLETLELFDKAGLTNVGVGGEMYRWEMYEHPAQRLEGVEFHGLVRSFDNRYYRKGSVVSDLAVREHWHNDELEFVMANTGKEIKMPITGPYTLMDWSFNEHYTDRYELLMEFARVVNGEIRSMKEVWSRANPGKKFQVQIDEPAATTHPDEMDIFVESINESIRGIDGLETSLHVCYSTDYRILYEVSEDLKIDGYNLEFANRDTLEAGTGDVERRAYASLKDFVENEGNKFIGVGVTDVHTDLIEPVELIIDRIAYAEKIIDDPTRLRINPDCGLRTRSREVGFQKLKNMVTAVNSMK